MNSKIKWSLAALLVAAVILVFASRTWTPDKDVPTVAIFNLLSHPILDASVEGIKAELQNQGYAEGRIRLIEVNANGEMNKLNTFALELLSTNPDVIVPVSTPVTQAVFDAASADQAIVFSTVTNPDDVGMQNRPANMTGVSDAVNYRANIDLIQRLMPNVKSIGVIYNQGERNSEFGVRQTQAIADERDLELVLVSVASSGEVADAATSMIGSVDVFYVGSDNTVVTAIDSLLSVAYENGIPVISSDAGSVEQGATAAISVDYQQVGRAAGELVSTVLKSGTSPGSLEPVVVHGDTLVVNLRSLDQLGLEVPPEMLQEAVKIQ